MADKKRRAALTTLELLRSIHEDDSDAESGIESDRTTDVYELFKDIVTVEIQRVNFHPIINR